jgi:hypothetical protein
VDLELAFTGFGLLPFAPGRRHTVEQNLVLTDAGIGADIDDFFHPDRLVFRVGVLDLNGNV